jgi:hypothetical protein
MIILHDSRRTISDALQLFVQSEDELWKRQVLARVSVNVHLRYDEGWKEGRALPQADRTDVSASAIASGKYRVSFHEIGSAWNDGSTIKALQSAPGIEY